MNIEISIQNLSYNISSMLNYIGRDIFICPMVKANAYGHGDKLVSEELIKHGINNLGVASVREGIELRKFFEDQNILVFSSDYDVLKVNEYKLTPVISQFHDLNKFIQANAKTEFHLKFDTGMGRYGFDAMDISKIKNIISKSSLKLKGVSTHLSSAYDINMDSGISRKQINIFKKIRSNWDSSIVDHFHNSASLLERKTKDHFGVRPGICIYGVYPPEITRHNFKLKPVMQVYSKVVQVKSLSKGSLISYGKSCVLTEDSRIAVIDIGYFDGLNRSLSNKLKVLIGGKIFSQIGIITMNSTIIKVDDSVNVGDKVTILGTDGNECISSMDLATWAGTIPNEILTSFGNGKL